MGRVEALPMRMGRWVAVASVAAVTCWQAPSVAGTTGQPTRASVVVGLVGESGLEVLHSEFRTRDGRDAALPSAAERSAVPVALPSPSLPYDTRVEQLRAGPLGKLKPSTLYYLRGTRLLIWTGSLREGSDNPPDIQGETVFHGTGTGSLVAGRTVGTAPDALLVVTLGYTDESWTWLAAQSWIDIATSSVIDLISAAAPVFCDGARAVAAFRRSGRLPYYIAGNGYFETLAYSPGHTAEAVRVGGVHTDGTPYHAQASTNYSGHGYDLAEAWTNRIATTATDKGISSAGGTSGSTPRVAGRAANLLMQARRLLGDNGTGARGGALAVQGKKAQVPQTGPLADGRLTSDELLDAQLATSTPSAPVPAFAYEGYGWANAEAERRAWQVISGEAPRPSRPLDDAAYAAATAARAAFTTAKGCTAPLQ